MRLIERAHWQSAKSVEHVAPHQYVVKGWDRDDLTDQEFWSFAQTIKAVGREEVWTPPEGFYDSGSRRPMTNTYAYLPSTAPTHAYWFTWPTVPMLNREHVSVQEESPTRRPMPEQLRFEEEQ